MICNENIMIKSLTNIKKRLIIRVEQFFFNWNTISQSKGIKYDEDEKVDLNINLNGDIIKFATMTYKFAYKFQQQNVYDKHS